MAIIDFKSVITDEAIQYAREASLKPGWYLTPKKWAITTSSGELSVNRTTSSMFTTWVNQPFSGVYGSSTNTLIHSIVIPPNAYETEMAIGEIYFIYEDYYGNEFLYAIAQPSSSLSYTPGVSQSYYFSFKLNNVNVSDTIIVEYNYPQDIEDHNQLIDAHEYLLARDGSRTATNILTYDKDLTFTNNRHIVDKKYVDTNISNLKNTVNSSINNIQKSINTIYCPPGTMMMYPKSTPPSGWLVRNGAAISRTTYKNLFNIIGTTFGVGNGSTTFNLPDDRGLFERGWDNGKGLDKDRLFASYQDSGVPNITSTMTATGACHDNRSNGAMYTQDGGDAAIGGSHWLNKTLIFDASRSSSVYKNGLTEVRVKNRAYLPIIKY